MLLVFENCGSGGECVEVEIRQGQGEIECRGGVTGRHAGLRNLCRKACGFESRPRHHQLIRRAMEIDEW